MDATYTHTTAEKLLGEVFSVLSMLRLYNEAQLPLDESLETVERRLGAWCKRAASLGVSQWSAVSWLVNE
jgi:hypothetical protein